MKIQVQQRGGFAGITHTLVDVDSEDVDPTQAAELKRLAHEFENVAKHANPGVGAGADFLTYDVTLQEGKRSKTLTIVDDDSPSMVKVRAVLEQISSLARGTH